MGKRGVIRQLLVSWRRQQQTGEPLPSAASRRAANLEVLEARQMLTAATDQVITVNWNGTTVHALEHEFVVELKPGANLTKLVKESNFQNVQDLGGGGTFYSLWSDKSLAQMEKWAANRPGSVVAVSPNVVTRIADVSLPNDPLLGDQWQYNNTGQIAPDPALDPDGQISFFTTGHTGGEAGTPDADIDAAEAWSIVQRDPNAGDVNKQIVVAVLDTGIDPNHPDLVNQIWTNPREIPGNGVDDDGNGQVDDVHGWNFVANTADVTDDNGHGTHVSGIIGASGNNSTGVTGVIQNVKILPVKVGSAQGSLTMVDIISGINYITRLKNEGVNIVVANGSFGGVDFPLNRVENDAISRMGQAGVLFTVAAGNDSLNSDVGQNFPGKFSLNQPNVITVAATDNHDNIAFFSNIGAASVQIAAPGLNILSTLPTYDVGTLMETGQIVPSNIKNYGYDSGTSMASPMVAGAIALMKAAKPDASPAELKAALLAGADRIPALAAPSNADSPLTSTAGRLNVYRAILNLLNERTNVDTATRGSWTGGIYGSQAAVVYGETGTAGDFSNSVLTARVSGAALQVYADTSNDPDALQQTLNHSSRIASQLTSAGPITLDLEFNDGQAHRVSLYQADLAGNAGPQTITLIDPDSGTVITSYGTGDLQTGEYDTFEVSPPSTLAAGGKYRVRMVITPNAAGKNAVLNGLFVDPATTDAGAKVVSDPVAGVTNVTGGDWRRQFGSEGAKVFGSGSTFGAPITVTGGTQVTKAQLRNNPAALLQPKATSDKQRVGGYLQTKGSMDITVDLSGYSRPQKLTVYAADLEKLGRAERLDLYDDTTGALLSSVDLTNFTAGKYVSWYVSGKVRIHVTKLAGPTAVIGGVFLDAAPGGSIQYEGMDVNSSGNWTTFYGGDAAFIIGSDDAPVRRSVYSSNLNNGASPTPADTKTQAVTVKFTNAVNNPPHTVVTGDSRFLSTPGSTKRVSNAKSTGNSMNVDIKFTDKTDHQVALYFVDPDKNNNRAERVDIQQIDPTTGKAFTVASQIVSDFSKGKYVVFNARQISASTAADVRVKITRIKGKTAVVNGVFFG